MELHLVRLHVISTLMFLFIYNPAFHYSIPLPRPYLSSIYSPSGSVSIQLNIFSIPFSPSRVSLASPSLPTPSPPYLLHSLPATRDSKRHCHPFREECRVTPRHGLSLGDDSWSSALLSFFLYMFNCLDDVPVSITSVCFCRVAFYRPLPTLSFLSGLQC